MIQGMHVTFYTRHADELRDFLRDKLELSAMDAGGGWLIFHPPAGEIAPHPAGEEGDEDEAPAPGVAQISFYCDDLEATMRQLKDRGVEFTTGVQDQGWGLLATFRAAPDVEMDLYQPRYGPDPSHG